MYHIAVIYHRYSVYIPLIYSILKLRPMGVDSLLRQTNITITHAVSMQVQNMRPLQNGTFCPISASG